MRVLATGDWHLDWVTDGRERFDDIAKAVERVVAQAMVFEVDLFVFLGDLANPGTSRAHRAVELAARVADKLGGVDIESVWISGNHDVAEDGHGTSTVGAIGALPKSIAVTTGAAVVRIGGATVIALPFTPRSHAYHSDAYLAGLLGSGRLDPKDPIIIAGHFSIEGIGPGAVVDELARGREVFFPLRQAAEFGALVLNGHYHAGGEFEGVHMPGSVARLAHGEERNEPSFILAEYKAWKKGKPSSWKVTRYGIEGGLELATVVPATVDGLSASQLLEVEGKLVRVLPPAGFRQDVAACEADLMAHGALAAKVMPPASSSAVVGSREQAKRERVGHRQVVDRMVVEAHSRDREALAALCGIVMDESGM